MGLSWDDLVEVHLNVLMFSKSYYKKPKPFQLLSFMVMNSQRSKEYLNVYRGTRAEMANKLGVSIRTINRHLKKLIEEDTIHEVEPNVWTFSFLFLPDEEFEELTGAPPHSCFMFLEERNEDEYDDEDACENFREKYYRIKAEYDSLPEYHE